MATIEDRGMTGRDVIAKTFTPKARRGYDPLQVDSYLEQVGNQIDALRDEIDRLEGELAEAHAAASAPPPPAPVEAAVVPDPVPAAPPVETAAPPVVAASGGEAADIVLRMAQETSAKAIDEANGRAEEILSDAEFKAAEMQRESDRKAFEAASRSQGELRSIQGEIDARRESLSSIEVDLQAQKSKLRGIADQILSIADTDPVAEAADNGDATIDLADTVADEADETELSNN